MKEAPKVPVTIRFEPTLYAKAVKAAQAEKRSFNAQVNLLLERALENTK